MMTFKLTYRYLRTFLFAAISTAAFAEINPGFRDDLFYSGGYFHRDGGNWSETIGNSTAYMFREIGRTDSYIDIFDDSRGMSVRLYNDSFWIKPQGQSNYTYFKAAHWDNRRLLSFGNPVYMYFLLGMGNLWKVVTINSDGTSSTVMWREVYRDSGRVELRNEAMATTLSLINGSVLRKVDGGEPVYILNDGVWSKP